MKSSLAKELQFLKFGVLNYQDFEATDFLNSEDPEEVMQAILAKHNDSGKLYIPIAKRLGIFFSFFFHLAALKILAIAKAIPVFFAFLTKKINLLKFPKPLRDGYRTNYKSNN